MHANGPAWSHGNRPSANRDAARSRGNRPSADRDAAARSNRDGSASASERDRFDDRRLLYRRL